MKREELLGWIGVVLAAPPLVYLVVGEGKYAAGVFVILLLAGLGREYFEAKRRKDKPPFTIVSVKKRLEIQDPAAKLTQFESTMNVRVNQRVQQFVSASLGGDGTVTNVKVDGVPAITAQVGSRMEIIKQFKRDLLPGEEFDVIISYDLNDTFPANTEGYGHVVEFETEALEVEVIFPPDRPCLNGIVLRRHAGAKQAHGDAKRAGTGQRLSFSVHRPLLGAEYILQWDW